MQAGTGSSLSRKKYLSQILNIPENEIKIGAKGTDLYIRLEENLISIAEAQMLQAYTDAVNCTYGAITLQDIISNETEESIENLWNKKSIIEPKLSNNQLIKNHPGINRFKKSHQSYIPSIDSNTKNISFNRMAPGGHALFGVEALIAAYKDELRPKYDNLSLISSIGNGEDLGSSPDKYMTAWMVEEQIPIAMVTTTKTNIDLKGGQIAIVDGENDFITMIEKAQAEQSNQLDFFYSLGLRANDNEAFFNTNMVLINYQVLSPIIKNLVQKIGEEKFLEIITPDLIQNQKEQIDKDGEKRSYIQLEGAMGSTFLNLDKYWRKNFSKPIVHFLNVDKINRTKFFSPIKTAFDFFMQIHSDRFRFNNKSFVLEYLSSNDLPNIELNDSFYNDLSNVLNTFNNTPIKDLLNLRIKGKCNMSDLTLVGNIEIINKGDSIIILKEMIDKKITQLENIKIIFETDGLVTTTSL